MSFQPTHWSLIHRVVESKDHASTEALCRAYRPPALAFIRRCGYRNDAEDLTQEFFSKVVLSRGLYARADRARGQFRHYLLRALKHFLASEQLRDARQKRGSGITPLSLEQDIVSLASIPSENDPERAFQREWVLTVIANARYYLAEQATISGHRELFLHLQPLLYDRPDAAAYQHIGEVLQMRSNSVAVAMHRLRVRMRQLIREELAATVSSNSDVDAELAALREILAETH